MYTLLPVCVQEKSQALGPVDGVFMKQDSDPREVLRQELVSKYALELAVAELFVVKLSENRCFACGPDNPEGLRLQFDYDAATKTSECF